MINTRKRLFSLNLHFTTYLTRICLLKINVRKRFAKHNFFYGKNKYTYINIVFSIHLYSTHNVFEQVGSLKF